MKKLFMAILLSAVATTAYAHQYITIHTVNFSMNDMKMVTESNKKGLTLIDAGCIDAPTPCQHDPMTLESHSPSIGATADVAITLPADTSHNGTLAFYWTQFADGAKYDVSKQQVNVTGYKITMSPEPCGAGDCDITITKM